MAPSQPASPTTPGTLSPMASSPPPRSLLTAALRALEIDNASLASS